MNVRRGETLSMCHGVFGGAMVRARHSFRSTVVRWPNARTEDDGSSHRWRLSILPSLWYQGRQVRPL